MVRTGETLTFEVTGTADPTFFKSAGDVRDDAIAALSPYMTVTHLTISPEDWGEALRFKWDYAASVTGTLLGNYRSTNDVALVVRHAFYEASGSIPTVTVGEGSQSQGIDRPSVSPFNVTMVTVGLIALAAIVVVPRVLPRQ